MACLPVVLVLLNTAANPKVQAAVDCFEQLDYRCTELRLAEALGGTLSDAERVRAYYYQALVAIAWREPARARRAVKAILKLDPSFNPVDAPKSLTTLFDENRPEKPRGWTPQFELRLRTTTPMDESGDALWWTGSRGVGIGGGLVNGSGYSLMLVANHEYHIARDPSLGLDELTRWSVDLEGGRWFFKSQFQIGIWGLLGGSYNQMKAQSAFGRLRALPQLDPFFGTTIGGGLMVKYQLTNALHIMGSSGGQMMFRSYQQQLRLSFLLPVQVGIRYE